MYVGSTEGTPLRKLDGFVDGDSTGFDEGTPLGTTVGVANPLGKVQEERGTH